MGTWRSRHGSAGGGAAARRSAAAEAAAATTVREDGTARLYAGRPDGLGASKPVDLGWGAR
ncbi:hypothetical protein [Streptomyces narbonensis]